MTQLDATGAFEHMRLALQVRIPVMLEHMAVPWAHAASATEGAIIDKATRATAMAVLVTLGVADCAAKA